MDAGEVRAFLTGLPDERAPHGHDRVRVMLEALQRPDVRLLLVSFVGGGAGAIARPARAILEAAGARTAALDDPLDEPLLARAGTLAAAATYQLAASRPDLGEPRRDEVQVTLALVAQAEAATRVVLLVDEALDPVSPLHAPVADLVVIGQVDAEGAARAIALVPEGRPCVAAAQSGSAERERLEAVSRERGVPLLLGGRDFTFAEEDGAVRVTIAGESYPGLPRAADVAPSELAAGVAAALGAGVLGIRMRDEWVTQGARIAARIGG